jgi:hypothetical protein
VRIAVADAALVDAHVGEPEESLLVRQRPADRLGQSIDASLVVVGDLDHRRPRSGDQVGDERLLHVGDFAGHRRAHVATCERCSPGE